MHCPTLEETSESTFALLPRGRAWQTNEGALLPGKEIGFNPDAFNPEAFSASQTEPSYLWRYWRSFAVVVNYLEQRLCALRAEFWCQTMSETREEWMKEYGLPDECDPFPDLCTKVAAVGGTRCEYYAEVANRAGWAITCGEGVAFCGARAGGGHSRAGRAKAGRLVGRAELRIFVNLTESPAFQPTGRYLPSIAGRMRTGRRLSCGPDLSPLLCLLSRIVHAEIKLIVEVGTNG